ncbi:ThiF family adenylyltransferase [Roseiconus lacunae]|uniref:ThiF family adenylyltransferase n=1 Tax=Roseiconus lacunae TaxID=2605694 RepID=UPI001E48253A|nr:ThiF family adenylyltransferase [Roseiconus lacunae]MCD0462154.1 ThiF family adenylyltransferase [Roseiconus lacunae]
MTADRFQRQADLVPRAGIESVTATVIGVGAVGRQVALQLASIGIRKLQLIDFDQVELTNVTTQGYRLDQIGRAKTAATAADAKAIDPKIEVNAIADRYRPHFKTGEAVIACVDSINARAAIWRSIQARCSVWIDGRMRGEVIRVLASDNPRRDSDYGKTLFDPSEAHAGSCTSSSTVYAASLAASLTVHQFTRWLREIPVERDVSVNLLASEMVSS